jgi:RNA polymerase II subunit A small phosphatase-like protein
MSQYYDIFIFTASLKEYANPVINIIDPGHRVKRRLFRE